MIDVCLLISARPQGGLLVEASNSPPLTGTKTTLTNDIVMTTHDQNKKTLRHFQCRDYLWEVFEQMSTELECSTDYLINEAMRQYARSRNYGTARRGDSEGLSTQPPPAS